MSLVMSGSLTDEWRNTTNIYIYIYNLEICDIKMILLLCFLDYSYNMLYCFYSHSIKTRVFQGFRAECCIKYSLQESVLSNCMCKVTWGWNWPSVLCQPVLMVCGGCTCTQKAFCGSFSFEEESSIIITLFLCCSTSLCEYHPWWLPSCSFSVQLSFNIQFVSVVFCVRFVLSDGEGE